VGKPFVGDPPLQGSQDEQLLVPQLPIGVLAEEAAGPAKTAIQAANAKIALRERKR
jgi:hypothetical protein